MKKKTLGLLAAVLSVAMLAGCGAKDTGNGTGTATGAGTESTALKDMDVDKYVTLGEYKGLEVSVDTILWKHYRGEWRNHGSGCRDRRHCKH